VNFHTSKIGTFDTELVEEFIRAFAVNSGVTIHIHLSCGKNSHHIAEAIFKALGRALDMAASIEPRLSNKPLSSKGEL
jgi:imidazoleglycerol-phosphate dehydratase